MPTDPISNATKAMKDAIDLIESLTAQREALLTAAESAFRALMGVVAIDPEQQDRITAARDGLNLAMCAAGYEGHLEAKEGT